MQTKPIALPPASFLILLGLPLCLLVVYLAGTSLGMAAALVLPMLVLGVSFLLSLPLSIYLVTFFLFSGIAWGLELPGGFLLVTLFFIAAWAIEQFLGKEPKIYLDSNMLLILLLMFFLVVSAIDAPWPQNSWAYLLQYGKLILFFFIFTNAINQSHLMRPLMIVATVSVGISVLYGVYALLAALGGGNILEEGLRLRGLTANPNVLGYNLLIIISFLVYSFFLIAEKRSSKIILLLLVAGSILALGATMSRAGLIGLGLLLFLVAWDFRARKWPIIAFVLFVIIGFLMLPPEIIERLSMIFTPYQDTSLRWRARLYAGAIELIQAYPINGLGLGNFIVVSNQFIAKHLGTHNAYLEIWSESGLFAFLAFVGLFLNSRRLLAQAVQHFEGKGDFWLVAIARSLRTSLLVLMFSALFGSIQTYFVLWTLFAMATVMGRLTVNEQPSQQA